MQQAKNKKFRKSEKKKITFGAKNHYNNETAVFTLNTLTSFSSVFFLPVILLHFRLVFLYTALYEITGLGYMEI